jgi:hypothetical protein
MKSAVRISSQRPVLMAIGPTAAQLLERRHMDLELVDVLVVDCTPSCSEMGWLAASHLLERSFTVIVFDAKDEASWPTARVIAREARLRTATPVWFVHPDSRARTQRTRMLTKLAHELAVCVVDPGECDTLSVALSAVAGLERCGLTGFDIADLSTIACPGAVGRARHGVETSVDASVDRAIVVMRCSNEVTLHDINEAAGEIAKRLPDADLLLATPTHPYMTDSTLDVSVLTFARAMMP